MRTCWRIDDAGAGVFIQQALQLALRVVARSDGVADVGPVEPRHDQPRFGNPQLGQNIGTGVAVGRGSQRQTRNIGKGIQQRPQQPVVGPEIVAPFRNAMRLVDSEQPYVATQQHFEEMRLAGAFGCDIEQIERTIEKTVDGCAAIHVHTGQRRGPDAVGAGRAQLIVHQRDQRRNHHACPLQQDSGQLIGQRFTRPGRHHRKGRLPGHDPPDNTILHAAKSGEAEHGVEPFKHGRVYRGSAGLGGIGNGHSPAMADLTGQGQARRPDDGGLPLNHVRHPAWRMGHP
ncbi:hypothetical protein NOLU111490_16565 [Novosphingobium lubricantis]